MNWDALGAIGEIVGAIAVVATLFHLANQLRQNTVSVQSAAYADWAKGTNAVLNSSNELPHVDRILRDGWFNGELTEDTWMTFMMWHLQYFYHLESVWQMYKRGALDTEIYDLEMARSAQLLAIPMVRSWWDAGGRHQVSASLAKELEAVALDPSKFTFVGWDKEKGFFATQANDAERVNASDA